MIDAAFGWLMRHSQLGAPQQVSRISKSRASDVSACPRVIEIDERVGFEQDPVMGSCSVHRLPINSDKTLSRAAGGEPRSTACRQQWLLHSTMAGPSAKRTATAIIEGRLGASKCTISEMLA